MISKNVKIFSNPLETASGFAGCFLEQVSKATTFTVALSGGSTPKLLFNCLAENQSKSDIWEKVEFYWGDERCVPPNNADSNYKMTKEHLLDKIEIPGKNIHRILGENEPQDEARRYSDLLLKNLSVKNRLPVFDLIILGMGEDGHTASIFPNQMDLLDSKNICAVAEHPVSGQKRITLTGAVINNANEIAFLVTGENKKEKVFEVLNKFGDWKKYPASHIDSVSGKVIWFLDKAVAYML